MAFILALDQGTSSSRSIVFDESWEIVGVAQREVRQVYPRSGWIEHDAEEIWDGQLATARDALQAASLTGSDIAAIGITNQRETLLVWDKQTGAPIHHAIVWQDRRTASRMRGLKERGVEPMVRRKTGLLLDPYFSASKLEWILDHVDGARDRALRGELAAGTIDSWLLFNLTGGRIHATDISNASRTLLFNIVERRWDEELLELFFIPASLLPEVVPSSKRLCDTDQSLFGVPIPVCGIAGDQQSALFGQRCFEPGMAKNTYGTGCFLVANTGHEPVIGRHDLLATVAWQIENRPPVYALEGSVFTAGAAIQWLRDKLGIISSAAEINTLAARVPDSDGVILVPAFAGLGAPHWDPDARAAILGMTQGTSAAHIARATLDAIAYQVAEIFELMERESGMSLKTLRVDGGAAASDILMRIQADMLGIPVARPVVLESTALGAALLAGLGAGLIDGVDSLADSRAEFDIFEPVVPPAERDRRMADWARAVERTRSWSTRRT